MRNQRRQINFRADDETAELLTSLVGRVSAELGIPISQSDAIRLALRELAKRYEAPKRGKGK